MCTVTFIPAGDRLFITHNRDERSLRPRAIAPGQYRVGGHTLLFPRDTQAGGTWIAVNANGAAAVLLNGAFVKHTSQPPYRKSRGLVLLDILASADAAMGWERIDLRGIEPFTVVLWSNGRLQEGRWDGQRKHSHLPDAAKAHTWSSVTLYDEAVRARREQWFARWRQQHPQPAQEDIWRYHLQGGEGDAHNDLCMNRGNGMLTVSITSLELTSHRCRMKYLDLQNNATYCHQLLFTQHPIVNP